MHSNPALINAIARQNNATLASHRLKVRQKSECRGDLMMIISERIIRLCKSVERLACELDCLTARGHAGTTHAVLMRMKLAAMTADLVTADLIERMRTEAPPAKANA